jgi:protease I
MGGIAMANQLNAKRVAFLATDGVEQVELTEPWKAVEQAGGRPELLGPKRGRIQAVKGMDKADTFDVTRTPAEASPDEFDGLVVPGGVKNPDTLRMDRPSVEFVRSFVTSGKPTAVICHGPWMLVEADVVRGRTLTSYPSLQTDIRNAGGTWVDEEVHNDRGLVTSRNPGDLPAFCAKLVEEIAEGVHSRQPVGAGAR